MIYRLGWFMNHFPELPSDKAMISICPQIPTVVPKWNHHLCLAWSWHHSVCPPLSLFRFSYIMHTAIAHNAGVHETAIKAINNFAFIIYTLLLKDNTYTYSDIADRRNHEADKSIYHNTHTLPALTLELYRILYEKSLVLIDSWLLAYLKISEIY